MRVFHHPQFLLPLLRIGICLIDRLTKTFSMNIDNDIKRFFIRRIKWIGLYLGICLILVLVLPIPYDLISIFGLYVLINLLRVRGIIFKGYGGEGGIKDLFRSMFPSMSGNDRSNPLKYYCMNCGKENREIECPNCGSKMKRIG
jgi:hypothetical protein